MSFCLLRVYYFPSYYVFGKEGRKANERKEGKRERRKGRRLDEGRKAVGMIMKLGREGRREAGRDGEREGIKGRKKRKRRVGRKDG